MEKKVLTSHNKVWIIILAWCAFASAGYLVIGLQSLGDGDSAGVRKVILGVLWLIFLVVWAWKMVVAGKGAVILDAEGIALYDCATNVAGTGKVERVGAVVLKWGDIESISKRLIKTTSGEVYTIWNATILGIGERHPWRIASPFGEKGWAEINRYYKEYKSNSKQ